MSTTQEAADMSSAASKSPDVQTETGINWERIFEEIGNEPYETCPSSQLTLMTSVNVEGVSDQQEAGECILDAVEAGELEQSSSGYTIPGAEPPEPEHGEAESETENVESDSGTDESESEDIQKDADEVAGQLDDAHSHIRNELSEMQEKVDEMHRAVNVQMPMMTTAMRNLFGDIAFEDMPEAANELRKQLDQNEEILQEVSDQVDAIDDLTEDKQETTESRVIRLRRYLVEQAEDSGGRFGMNDNAIKSFFQGEISRSWASQLLDKAADHEAFTKKTFSDKRPKQVRVNLDKVPEGSIYRLKNSEESREA